MFVEFHLSLCNSHTKSSRKSAMAFSDIQFRIQQSAIFKSHWLFMFIQSSLKTFGHTFTLHHIIYQLKTWCMYSIMNCILELYNDQSCGSRRYKIFIILTRDDFNSNYIMYIFSNFQIKASRKVRQGFMQYIHWPIFGQTTCDYIILQTLKL